MTLLLQRFCIETVLPDVSNLVKKTDYNTKISEIENKINEDDYDKYITTSEFNKLTTENFKARLGQADLLTKTDFVLNCKILVNKLLQVNQSICLLRMY